MEPLRSLLENWFAREPAACLWLAVVALLLFGLSFAQSKSGDPSDGASAWSWLRRLVESLAKALAFVGLAAMLYFLLASRYTAFDQIYASFTHDGSLSNNALDAWLREYGGTFVQQDLTVTQYIRAEKVEQYLPSATPTPAWMNRQPTPIPTLTATPTQPAELALRPTLPTLVELVEPGTPTVTITPTATRATLAATPTPTGPALYYTVVTEEALSLNSITAFDGRVTINLAHPEQQPDSFNGYALTARYEYQVTNPSDQPTRAEFRFPLSASTWLYQQIHVTRNGQDIPSWRVADQAITWDIAMQPGQRDDVSISYQTWGTHGFFFEVAEPREVTNFRLTLALDAPFCCLVTEPSDGAIQLDSQNQSNNSFHTWKIERAIMAPRLGMEYWQHWPYAPFYEMTVVPSYAPRAGVLFLCLAALTLLICGAPVRLPRMALLAGLFLLPFLIFMAGGLPLPSSVPPARFAGTQVKLLPVISLLPLALAFWTLRQTRPRLPRLPRGLLLALLMLFIGGYGLIGLLPDFQKRNAAESAVQAAMIGYIFLLALFTRLRKASRARTPGFSRTPGVSRTLLPPFLRAVRFPALHLHLPPIKAPRIHAPHLPRLTPAARQKYIRLALLAILLLAIILLGSGERLLHFTRPHLPPSPGTRMTPIPTPPAPVDGAAADGPLPRYGRHFRASAFYRE